MIHGFILTPKNICQLLSVPDKCAVSVPELQGEPRDIAKQKCLLAAEKVCVLFMLQIKLKS